MYTQFRYILPFYIIIFTVVSAVAQVEMPDNVCVGAVKHYNVDPNLVPGSTYTWKIDGVTASNSITNEIHITWNNTGIYLLEVRELSVDGCPGPLRSGYVFVSPVPQSDANSNSPVCENSSISLAAETISDATYLWSGPNEYSSSSQNPQISSASSMDAGIYSLTVSSNGCASEISNVSILVNNCIDFFIPEGFSPNSDGINDVFVIRGIENYPANTFTIFNRWGNKIFEANNYQNTWNGKSTMGLRIGSDALPTGTYFYLLDLGDGSAIFKGTIYLNR